jgi:hypothetical protein
MPRRVNLKFVIRVLIGFLALTAIALALASTRAAEIVGWALSSYSPPPPITPAPPTILAPTGSMPSANPALVEWAGVAGQQPQRVGSGFLLEIPDGTVIGVTTAHSLATLGAEALRPDRVLFTQQDSDEATLTFQALCGEPGSPRTGDDLSVDYVLLRMDQETDPRLVLQADPRGAPQPGERVVMFMGWGDGAGGRRELPGTVISSGPTAIWLLMDDDFPPGGSGSPVVSQHTGQVVGMAIAAMPRRRSLMIGLHPIDSIVRRAQSAAEFPLLRDFRR